MKSSALVVIGTLSLAACTTTQQAAAPAAIAQNKTTKNDGGARAPDPKATPASRVETFRDLASFGAIYFDLDSDAIKAESRERLAQVADYLQASPSVGVTIEGHCDERGTPEYNMSLGERRAHAIHRYLTALGVGSAQLRTISFGKERPAIAGSGENVWSKNRRGEFSTAGVADDTEAVNDEG